MNLKSLAVLISTLAVVGSANALPYLEGTITFAGGAIMDNPNLNIATRVDTWTVPTIVLDVSDDLDIFADPFDIATLSAPWNFNTATTISSFWKVGSVGNELIFDLTSSWIVKQSGGFLEVSGVGVLKANGFDDTPGSWKFTTQEDDVYGRFSFSASSSALPDGGSTLALLGFGLIGLSAYSRKSRI